MRLECLIEILQIMKKTQMSCMFTFCTPGLYGFKCKDEFLTFLAY